LDTAANRLNGWNRYEIEHDNLRVALEWSLMTMQKEVEIAGLQLAVILRAEFWRLHGYHQ
jgi:hypothetical protein